MKEEYRNQIIYERDNFTCQYCGLDASKDFEIWYIAKLSIDHIKPQVLGGTDDDENLVVACHACNNFKQKNDYGSFEETREGVLKYKREVAKGWFERYVLKK